MRFVPRMTTGTITLFKFIIAHHCLKSPNKSCAANGYAHMHDLMQDDNARKSISGEFNFGIREFKGNILKLSPIPKFSKTSGFLGIIIFIVAPPLDYRNLQRSKA